MEGFLPGQPAGLQAHPPLRFRELNLAAAHHGAEKVSADVLAVLVVFIYLQRSGGRQDDAARLLRQLPDAAGPLVLARFQAAAGDHP